MNSGRRVRSATPVAGMPSSRKIRSINLGQVLPPHAPMPQRVTAFRWFMSRMPVRISARSSCAVTRSHRHTISSAPIGCSKRSARSACHGSCTRMPAMRGAISAGALTRTRSARSASRGARTRVTITLPSTAPSQSSTVTVSPFAMRRAENS